ncbi:hypothetical protein BD413DRAFT_100137 [Trametes elegans]|nr:hypothetical protein BD413DRAFT_100137 [Trametes elegans]
MSRLAVDVFSRPLPESRRARAGPRTPDSCLAPPRASLLEDSTAGGRERRRSARCASSCIPSRLSHLACTYHSGRRPRRDMQRVGPIGLGSYPAPAEAFRRGSLNPEIDSAPARLLTPIPPLRSSQLTWTARLCSLAAVRSPRNVREPTPLLDKYSSWIFLGRIGCLGEACAQPYLGQIFLPALSPPQSKRPTVHPCRRQDTT